MNEPNDTVPALPAPTAVEIETRIYEEKIGEHQYIGMEFPNDFFDDLNVKSGDTFTWERVDTDTYTIKINRK